MLRYQHSHSRNFDVVSFCLFMRSAKLLTRALAATAILAFTAGVSAPAHAQNTGQNGAAPATIADKRVSIDAEDATLSSVLTTLMRNAGANYTLDSSLRQIRVTAHLHDLRLETLLDVLLRSTTPAVTYRVETGVYGFIIKPEPTAPRGEPQDQEPVTRFDTSGVRHLQIVRVSFIDAAEAARILGGISIRSSEGQTYGLIDPNKLLGVVSSASGSNAPMAGAAGGQANAGNGANTGGTVPANFLDYLWIVNAGAGF